VRRLPHPRRPVRRRLGILRCAAAAIATRERTGTGLHRRGILARLTFALDLRRQRDDVSRADLRELRQVLIASRAQGKPCPTLLILIRKKKEGFQIARLNMLYVRKLPLPTWRSVRLEVVGMGAGAGVATRSGAASGCRPGPELAV
jgi:hypothetical protein